MIPYIKYNNVNWIDGMKITKAHFVDEENACIDRIRDNAAIFINSYNYGLLKPVPGKERSLDFTVEPDKNNLIRVKLYECRAITPSGSRIEIHPEILNVKTDNGPCMQVELNYTGTVSKILFLVISVDPYHKNVIGIQDTGENPPRLPYTSPRYALNILSEEDISRVNSGLFHITIGKLKVANNLVEVVDKYIPPCNSIMSHPELVGIYDDLNSFLSQFEKDVTRIITEIYRKDQKGVLPQCVLYLCESIMMYLSVNIPVFRHIASGLPPVYMIQFFSSLARVIKNCIDVKTGSGKEQMLTYFKDWIIEIKQGEFDAIVTDMMNVLYEHDDIQQSMENLVMFVKVISTVFNKLSKLDYIGDKKQAVIAHSYKQADAEDAKPAEPKKRSYTL